MQRAIHSETSIDNQIQSVIAKIHDLRSVFFIPIRDQRTIDIFFTWLKVHEGNKYEEEIVDFTNSLNFLLAEEGVAEEYRIALIELQWASIRFQKLLNN